MNTSFIAAGVLLVPLCLAYLACYAIPAAYEILPENTPGPVIGIVLTGLNLFRYFTLRSKPHRHSQLEVPLLEKEESKTKEHRLASSHVIMQSLVTFLAIDAFFHCFNFAAGFLLLLILSLEVLLKLHIGGIVCGFIAGIAMSFAPPDTFRQGLVQAIASGVIFHAVISHYLPSWDDVRLSATTFFLCSTSVVVLLLAIGILQFTI